MTEDWVRDPDEIYRRSFAVVRAEARLDHLPADLTDVAIRVIHASGMVDVAADLDFSPGAGDLGRAALRRGAPVLVDAEMLAAGIIRSGLPAANQIVCTLGEVAATPGMTRSALAVDRWDPWLEGAVVAIGNAPTALFRLLERLAEGAPRPALILGFPVGFIGAAESKRALAQSGHPFIALHGRRGGTAMAAAAINALTKGCA